MVFRTATVQLGIDGRRSSILLFAVRVAERPSVPMAMATLQRSLLPSESDQSIDPFLLQHQRFPSSSNCTVLRNHPACLQCTEELLFATWCRTASLRPGKQTSNDSDQYASPVPNRRKRDLQFLRPALYAVLPVEDKRISLRTPRELALLVQFYNLGRNLFKTASQQHPFFLQIAIDPNRKPLLSYPSLHTQHRSLKT
jgi:hypothetical protein